VIEQTGEGLTVIVKVFEVPVQLATGLPPVLTGVTVMVATTFVVPLFTATKDGILPVPLAASPIEVLSFVHV
jgi:hypothetical protein